MNSRSFCCVKWYSTSAWASDTDLKKKKIHLAFAPNIHLLYLENTVVCFTTSRASHVFIMAFLYNLLPFATQIATDFLFFSSRLKSYFFNKWTLIKSASFSALLFCLIYFFVYCLSLPLFKGQEIHCFHDLFFELFQRLL